MHQIIEQVCDQYLNPKHAWMFGTEVHRAMTEFSGSDGPLYEAALPFFADWFTFDFPIFGSETPLMRFYSMNPLGLSNHELAQCKRLIEENRYDFFEVLTNKRGFLRVRSVRTAEEFDINDRAMQCAVGDVFVSRIIPEENGWHVVSMDPIGMPTPSKRDKARMRNEFPALDPRVVYHEIVAAGAMEQ